MLVKAGIPGTENDVDDASDKMWRYPAPEAGASLGLRVSRENRGIVIDEPCSRSFEVAPFGRLNGNMVGLAACLCKLDGKLLFMLSTRSVGPSYSSSTALKTRGRSSEEIMVCVARSYWSFITQGVVEQPEMGLLLVNDRCSLECSFH